MREVGGGGGGKNTTEPYGGKRGRGRKLGKFHCDTTNILRPPTDQKQLLWQIMTTPLH